MGLKVAARAVTAWWLLLASLSVAAAPAFAQEFPPGGGGGGDPVTGNLTPPAEKVLVTPGGVDMRTGQYTYSNADLALGAGGEAAQINLVRRSMIGVPFHANPFGNFTHNFDIMITEFRVDMAKGQYQHGYGTDYRMGVRYGGTTQTFEMLSTYSGFTPVSLGQRGVLTYSGTPSSAGVVYTFRAASGEVAVFRPMGGSDCASVIRCAYVSSITYPDGTLLSFEYETTSGTGNLARLRSVTSNHGFAVLFEYGGSGTWNTVTKACLINLTLVTKPASNVCPSGVQQATYTYSTGGSIPALTSWTNAAGETEQYGYTGNFQQIRFYRPGQSTPWQTQDLFGASTDEWGGYILQVTSQTFADGGYVAYDYDDPSVFTGGTSTMRFGGRYIENGNEVWAKYGFHVYPPSLTPPTGVPVMLGDVMHQMTSGPERIVDALGRETTFDYCDPFYVQYLPPGEWHRCVVGELRSWTDPEGNVTRVSFDPVGNLVGTRRVAKPGSGLPDIVTSATYACGNPKTCSKPATMTDGNGNTTTWTYDATHGGVLKQTSPAVGGVSPQTRYNYAQRYAWVQSGGGYAPVAVPVWVLTGEEYCRTSNADANGNCAAGSSDEVVTTYEYQTGGASTPSNVMLKGVVVTADGTSLRTCYGLDAYGRRISETQPNANLSTCS